MLNRVLRTRSSLLLSEGRTDDALANQIVLLKLTRLWRREPLIFAYLVTAVCELGAMEGVNDVLQAGPVSPASGAALDAELALHDTMEGYDRSRDGTGYALVVSRHSWREVLVAPWFSQPVGARPHRANRSLPAKRRAAPTRTSSRIKKRHLQ